MPEERGHGVADAVMLLTSLCVAVPASSYLANISSAPLWKFYSGVGLTFFLALAGLTRRAGWADAIRFLMRPGPACGPCRLDLNSSPLTHFPRRPVKDRRARELVKNQLCSSLE